MKDQILKIAKVKSEKEFYKKYPSEEAFMKAHGKAFKKAAMGSKMVNDQLHQLTDFGNPPIAQYGIGMKKKPQNFNNYLQGTNQAGMNPDGSMKQVGDAFNNASMAKMSGQQMGSDMSAQFATPSADKLLGKNDINSGAKAGGFDAAGAGMAALGALPAIIGGIEAIGAQKKAKKKAEQATQLSGLALTAQQTNERPKNQYVRPEDDKVQPGQLGNPYGNKTNYLQAQNGTMIGGNPTEIQNTYAPTGDLYRDLGYEPLEESVYKQYRRGGEMPKAEFGEYFQDSGQAQIGSAVGTAAGTALFGPLGGMVGGFLGKGVGNLVGGAKQARELQKEKDKTAMNTSQMGFMQNRSQGPLNANVKNGGWISHDWQPQTFTKFGEYSAKDLLRPPHDADMLRAGGSIGSGYYTPPSAEAMYTDRAQNGTMLDSYIRSKEDLQSITDNGRYNENLRSATSSTDRYTDGRPMEKTDMYSMTRGQGDNQRVKEFLRSQTGDGAPQYSMQKTYKPLFSDQYKTVSREIGAGRGERRMADMEQFLNEGKMENGGQMALGGELQIGEGGYAETLSYNPNLPGGEIGMFRGASHDNGGIQTQYGENGVEVEGGEPFTVLEDNGSEDGNNLEGGGSKENLVVFGNIKINKEIADLMGDPKAKGKKFKTYVADVAKNDAKQLKTIQKGLDLIEDYDGNSSYDKLGMNSGMANLMGAKAQQKINADKIKEAGIVQDSIHKVANEYGVKSDKLAEGKFEKETDPSMMAQNGTLLDKLKGLDDEALLDPNYPERMQALQEYYSLNNADREMMKRGMSKPGFMGLGATDLPEAVVTGNRTKSKRLPEEIIPLERTGLPLYEPLAPQLFTGEMPNVEMAFQQAQAQAEPQVEPQGKGPRKPIDWKKLGDIGKVALSYAEPWLRPSNANEDLNPDQLMGEYYALANNQLDPVQSQSYQPMLDTPYDISFNDQINAIDSQSRAFLRAAGSNPAAQAAVMAQTIEAKNKLFGEANRVNQANKMGVYDKNRAIINDAKLKNLAINDQQYVRQSEAKSNTKAQTQAALNSISAKVAQQRASNRKLAIMENLYNFRFSPSGKAISMNAPAQFNISGNPFNRSTMGMGSLAEGYEDLLNTSGQRVGTRRIPKADTSSLNDLDNFLGKNGSKTSKTKARNSSIVKALKNL